MNQPGLQETRPLAGLSLHKYGRFWAVYDWHTLVVIAVYKKGALEVMRRLTAMDAPPEAHQYGGHDGSTT